MQRAHEGGEGEVEEEGQHDGHEETCRRVEGAASQDEEEARKQAVGPARGEKEVDECSVRTGSGEGRHVWGFSLRDGG